MEGTSADIFASQDRAAGAALAPTSNAAAGEAATSTMPNTKDRIGLCVADEIAIPFDNLRVVPNCNQEMGYGTVQYIYCTVL